MGGIVKWTVLMTAFVLTSCTGDIRMGKTWTAHELLDLADRTLGTQAAVARIECRRPAEAGRPSLLCGMIAGMTTSNCGSARWVSISELWAAW